MIRRLERDGLVQRRPDPADGRASLIFLTARSREFAPVAAQVLRELDQLVRRRLDRDRVAAFTSALRELMELE
jgi:MarR family transcriptional regulator for hemolysin